MKKITSFSIDSSPIPSGGSTKTYKISGDPRAAFSIIVTNNAGEFYNFPENTTVSIEEGVFKPSGSFSSTPARLSTKTINNSGVYNGTISFPVVTGDDKYTVILQAETYLNTKFEENISLNAVYHAAEIYQYLDTTVSFAVASTGTTYANENSDAEAAERYKVVGPSTSVTNAGFNAPITLSWAVSISSSQFVIARQPVVDDFYFTTTKDTFSASADGAGTVLELKDISGLSTGMAVSGDGIAGGCTIVQIKKGYKDENKSVATKAVYTIPKDINVVSKTIIDSKGGTVVLSAATTSQVVDRTITFKGFGSGGSSEFNNTRFSISNFNLTIAPVVTTTDVAVDDDATITITSTDGIKAVDTVIMSGIGVVGTPHVDSISSGVSVEASAAQTIENGQTITFTGSSRNATITADIVVEKYGKDNLTLTLELDNILTIG
tara:strand:+ start:1381 stop:2688 length:1308 start_codon:yes stop_codon:yes gene_type:complete